MLQMSSSIGTAVTLCSFIFVSLLVLFLCLHVFLIIVMNAAVTNRPLATNFMNTAVPIHNTIQNNCIYHI
jgi:hypothetical protein